jgi:Fic family protein
VQVSDFTADKSGELVKNFDGHWTFVPNPLPLLKFSWSNSLARCLSEADMAIGRLVGIAQNLRDPRRLLLRSFLRREAELSSRIEGTFATFQDLVLFEQTQSAERRAPDVREVENNFQALSFGLEAVGQHRRAITLGLIKEMHGILLRSVRGHDRTPGQFRAVQAHLGNSDRIETARFVPPPPHLIQPAMESLEAFISSATELPVLCSV